MKLVNQQLNQKACSYINQLCMEIPERCVGSEGNRRAADLLESYLQSFNFETYKPSFDCVEWRGGEATLQVDGEDFSVMVSPYSRGGKVSAPLVTLSSVEELKQVEGEGKVILLKGEIAREQLLPKNFPFFNLSEHKEIIDLLESGIAKAVICATSYNPEMAGGVYPFPLIEDGDFVLPSVYTTERVGERLAAHQGKDVLLEVEATRQSAKGYNVVARKGKGSIPKVVFCAHLDSKQGTPGAIDNAAGLVALILFAELLKDYQSSLAVEIVAINGEDYYSNPGEALYMKELQNSSESIILGVNIDGAGYIKGDTAVSDYDCSAVVKELISCLINKTPGVIQGEPWYQGDHALFIQNRIPAMGITSERMKDVLAVSHTPKDTPDLVDCNKLVTVAVFLYNLMQELEKTGTRGQVPCPKN